MDLLEILSIAITSLLCGALGSVIVWITLGNWIVDRGVERKLKAFWVFLLHASADKDNKEINVLFTNLSRRAFDLARGDPVLKKQIEGWMMSLTPKIVERIMVEYGMEPGDAKTAAYSKRGKGGVLEKAAAAMRLLGIEL